MSTLNGIWSFCADANPIAETYGANPKTANNPLRVTARIGESSFAAPLDVPARGAAERSPAIDLPSRLLDGKSLRVSVCANAEFAETGGGAVVLEDVRLELYTPDGITSVWPVSRNELPLPLGIDRRIAGERGAEFTFALLPLENLIGARLVPTLRVGAEAVPEKKRLLVSLDGKEWFGAELEKYADGGEHDITVEIPANRLTAGEASVIVSSNIDSPGNMGGATLDLIHLSGGESAGRSYISNSLTDWTGARHADRSLMIALKLKTADGESTELNYGGGGGRMTCVIGKYIGGASFYHRQDFTLPAGEFVYATVTVRAHVGAEIRTAQESRGFENYTNYALCTELVDIGADGICRAVINLPSALDIKSVAKLTVRAAAKGAPRSARVYVSVNGGAKRAAYAIPQTGRLGGGYFGLDENRDETVELELPVAVAEFHAGENTLEFSADPVGRGALALYREKADGEVSVGLTVYAPPADGWLDAPVPATWETYAPDAKGRGRYVDFDGVGWYKRQIELGGEIGGFHSLRFGGVDYYCELWYDDLFIGSHEGGYDEFSFDLEPLLPGCARRGELVARVTDQSFDVRDKFYIKDTPAGFLQDSIGMNYAGIWQPAELRHVSDITVCDLFPLPNLVESKVELRVKLRSVAASTAEVTLRAEVTGDGLTRRSTPVTVTVGAFCGAEATLCVDMSGFALWTAESPCLYTAAVTAEADGAALTGADARFGMRSLETMGTEVLFNGNKIVLTGVLDWLFNFDIFSPAIEPERFRAELLSLRDAGFNAVKYCLVVPPEYMLDIHDEVGMYAYVEYPMWQERETPELFRRAYAQLPRLVCQNRSHPSLVMSDFNCELPDYSAEMDALMKRIVSEAKRLAPNRLFLDNSSNGTQRYGDLCAVHPYHQLNKFSEVAELYVKNRERVKPMVFGEYADTDSVRDTAGIRGRSGGGLPWWWERFGIMNPLTTLAEQGISEAEIAEITRVSVENAQEAKKYYIEETKKSPDIAALFITHKNDVGPTIPGFFDELGGFRFDAAELSRSARENALLLDIASFNFSAGSKAEAALLLAPNGAYSVTDGGADWTLRDEDGAVIASGTLDDTADADTKRPRLTRLGGLRFALPEVDAPRRLHLSARYSCREFYTENAWNLWVYPASRVSGCGLAIYDPGDVLGLAEYYPGAAAITGGELPANAKAVLVTAITPEIKAYLAGGGTLLYAGAGSEFLPVSKVYNWNAYSMPFIPDTASPALGGVGKRGFGCLDFLELFTEDAIASGQPAEHVIMRRIEHRSYKVGSYLTEINVGGGRLIQTTLRLGESPVDVLRGGGVWLNAERENIAGRYLLDRLIRYALRE